MISLIQAIPTVATVRTSNHRPTDACAFSSSAAEPANSAGWVTSAKVRKSTYVKTTTTESETLSRPRPSAVMSAPASKAAGTAAGAFPCPRFGLQLPCFARAAAGADEALRPARRKEILGARLFIRKTLLELDQRAGKIAHGRLPKRQVFVICSNPFPLAVPPLITLPDTEA